jgi:hypothetical protein
LKTIGIVTSFAILSYLLSLGLVNDYNVLDHLAMVDRLQSGGTLYSGASDFPTMASSNYFPGLSFVIIATQLFVSDGFLVEALHLVGLMALLWFFLIQFLISRDLETIPAEHFAAIWVFSTLLLLANWHMYALKFKPDTLALAIGMTALYCLEKTGGLSRKNMLLVLGFSILLAVPLIFKQQYIAFIGGFVVYSFFQRSAKNMLAAAVSIGVASLVVYFVGSIENAWLWTFEVLSDDGLVNLWAWGFDHLKLSIRLAAALIILIGIAGFGVLSPLAKPYEFVMVRMQLLNKPWAMPLIFASAASFLSGLKAGGNAGNTELAIMLLLPFIIMIFRNIEVKVSYAIAIVALLTVIGDGYRGFKDYQNLGNATAFFNDINSQASDLVFTSSAYYGVVRGQRQKMGLHNWHHEILMNMTSDDELPNMIVTKGFNYSVLPIFNPIGVRLKSDYGYQEIYSDKQLVILKRS